MATVPGRGPHGEATLITVLARGDQVQVQVGTRPVVLLSVEQALALLRALRTEFDQAASTMLDTRRASPGRRAARPNPGTGPHERGT